MSDDYSPSVFDLPQPGESTVREVVIEGSCTLHDLKALYDSARDLPDFEGQPQHVKDGFTVLHALLYAAQEYATQLARTVAKPPRV